MSAIAQALNNDHIFLFLSTRTAKSLCFQIPAIIQAQRLHTATVVLQPMLEIISRQVRSLSRYEIEVEVFASTIRNHKRDLVVRRIRTQDYRPALIYTTAESFLDLMVVCLPLYGTRGLWLASYWMKLTQYAAGKTSGRLS